MEGWHTNSVGESVRHYWVLLVFKFPQLFLGALHSDVVKAADLHRDLTTREEPRTMQARRSSTFSHEPLWRCSRLDQSQFLIRWVYPGSRSQRLFSVAGALLRL